MHALEFSTELQNAEISPANLLKYDSTANKVQAMLKIVGTHSENICGRVSFQ